MLLSYCFAAIIAYIVTNTIAASTPCSSILYSSLSCLEGNKAAASACSSRLSTIPEKVMVAAGADNGAATVTFTNLQTYTIFVTTSSYAYSVSTSTIMATSTKTTYVSAAPTLARPLKGRATACTVSKALETLYAMPSASLATACSCIGAPAVSGSPTVGNKIAGATSTTTVNAGLTITSFVNTGATAFAQTVTLTSTTTMILAAPTYLHVYAAPAGCQDIPTVDTLQLDPSITNIENAIAMCQNSCSQNGRCASLFVQYLFPNYGNTTPVYKCFMNGQKFDEKSSLLCGLAEDVWGAADAFDAIGRGMPV